MQTVYSAPGSPWQNGYGESFKGTSSVKQGLTSYGFFYVLPGHMQIAT